MKIMGFRLKSVFGRKAAHHEYGYSGAPRRSMTDRVLGGVDTVGNLTYAGSAALGIGAAGYAAYENFDDIKTFLRLIKDVMTPPHDISKAIDRFIGGDEAGATEEAKKEGDELKQAANGASVDANAAVAKVDAPSAAGLGVSQAFNGDGLFDVKKGLQITLNVPGEGDRSTRELKLDGEFKTNADILKALGEKDPSAVNSVGNVLELSYQDSKGKSWHQNLEMIGNGEFRTYNGENYGDTGNTFNGVWKMPDWFSRPDQKGKYQQSVLETAENDGRFGAAHISNGLNGNSGNEVVETVPASQVVGSMSAGWSSDQGMLMQSGLKLGMQLNAKEGGWFRSGTDDLSMATFALNKETGERSLSIHKGIGSETDNSLIQAVTKDGEAALTFSRMEDGVQNRVLVSGLEAGDVNIDKGTLGFSAKGREALGSANRMMGGNGFLEGLIGRTGIDQTGMDYTTMIDGKTKEVSQIAKFPDGGFLVAKDGVLLAGRENENGEFEAKTIQDANLKIGIDGSVKASGETSEFIGRFAKGEASLDGANMIEDVGSRTTGFSPLENLVAASSKAQANFMKEDASVVPAGKKAKAEMSIGD
jgi:hypothetical protein